MGPFFAALMVLGAGLAMLIVAIGRWLEIPMPWEVRWVSTPMASNKSHWSTAEIFVCEGCGSGPWDIAWDPHEQPVLGPRGGRFCPNCSGAD